MAKSPTTIASRWFYAVVAILAIAAFLTRDTPLIAAPLAIIALIALGGLWYAGPSLRS